MSAEEARKEVLALMNQKDKLESDIQELTSVLERQGVGMNDPLVDADDFPVQNLDIYQIRHVRQKIICLQNDHKAVMKKIESGLVNYYDPNNKSSNSKSEPMDVAPSSTATVYTEPFAKVNLVREGSPADYANLKVGDLIVEFGSINKNNFKNVMDIANVVQHSEGQKVHVKVKRGDHFLNTTLIPKTWVGQGLLGCVIVSL